MAPSSRREIEEQVRNTKSRLRDALKAYTSEDTALHLDELRKQLDVAEDTVTSALHAEKVRLSTIYKYEAYAEAIWPTSVAWTEDANQLYQQLSGYIAFKVSVERPRYKEEHAVKARTVTSWMSMLLTGVVQRIREREVVTAIIRGKAYDHSDGLPYRLRRFVASVVEKEGLSRHARKRLFYGRAELNILMLSLSVQVLISFYSGVRPSSLTQYSKNSSFLCVQDIRIVQQQRWKYTIEMNVTNIKRFNDALRKGMQQRWILQPITKVQNATLDLGVWLIPFLVSRASVTCVGEGPLFLAANSGQGSLMEGRPQLSANLATEFRAACFRATSSNRHIRLPTRCR
ncbi:unnamed protein product [Tilletia controversa]|uniref:Uncharacterized protein n=2 Tax=Tilletia TaxID=13289 RepID=A0A8X7MMT7_9BASI|nr:hypothetical protein A4X06_0g7150 [Tilletia controversa]CAD6952418.1 unnamed protein product [Tilletia caries]CAD6952913.1 unnamed protein product [Tilletia controversa]